eukprot:3592686-Lingulodinium_polyedra.AAC.1
MPVRLHRALAIEPLEPMEVGDQLLGLPGLDQESIQQDLVRNIRLQIRENEARIPEEIAHLIISQPLNRLQVHECILLVE